VLHGDKIDKQSSVGAQPPYLFYPAPLVRTRWGAGLARRRILAHATVIAFPVTTREPDANS